MKLIGTFDVAEYTVEAYVPERGREDIWTFWVVREGRVVSEFTHGMTIGGTYGLCKDSLARLQLSAIEAVINCSVS